jgi:cellulose synthase/poly-beta-1,6-N-acetylglucosamine synthase-like glycosyltransferase
MILFADLLLAAISVPPALACLYLLILTLLSFKMRAEPPSTRRLRFDIFVPAHNEASIIERTVANLRQIDWPADRFRIVVIADNCDDETAVLARAAGAQVLERSDLSRRGKGYALKHAFAWSAAEDWADAVVVIDADAIVSSNLLEAYATRIEQGANAVQVHYGVLNPHDSWRTRLLTIAKASFHIVRSRAREKLGISCGVRGNGWCVTHHALRKVPYDAFSLAEDLEYGIALGLGFFRVHYADEASSNADMVSSAGIAGKQRQRWEDGRKQMVRTCVLPLLKVGLGKPNRVCLDLALDLIVPPLSSLATWVLASGLFGIAGRYWLGTSALWPELALAGTVVLLLYVLRGWQLSKLGLQGLLDLGRAPFFILWKAVVLLRRRGASTWVRTEREP